MKALSPRRVHLRRLLVATSILLCAALPAAALETELAAEIDGIFADLDGVRSPGCALGVVQQRTLVYQRGYGMASLENAVPIDENTVFYTGSVSKQFTAAAVAMAAREGHLSLDDDIRKWFPEIRDYGAPITVRHLVHHTSGLRDYLGLMSLAGVPFENVVSAEWVIDLIARQKALNFTPGEQYLYSNSGYFMMAQLVGRATGRSMREYSEEKFFGPLGMRHTHFHDDRFHVVENRALAYSASDGGFIVNWTPTFDQVGSGGLLSTIEDLLEWDRSYYDGRLGEGFWDSLEVRGELRDGEKLSYAFGLTIDEYAGHRRIQHGGAMFGYRAQLSRFPDQQLTVAVLCNLASANPAGRSSKVADLFLEKTGTTPADAAEDAAEKLAEPDPVDRDPVDLRAEQLDAWVGVYEIQNGLDVEIKRDGAALVARVPGGPEVSLVPISDSEFLITEAQPPITDPTVRFTKSEEATLMTVELAGNPISAARVARREDDADRLAAWIGSYRSDELAATAIIEGVVESGALTYRIGSTPAREPIARADWTLSLPGMSAKGELGTDGKIDAFVVHAGRVRGIRFDRAPP